jgi:hypothetical protein
VLEGCDVGFSSAVSEAAALAGTGTGRVDPQTLLLAVAAGNGPAATLLAGATTERRESSAVIDPGGQAATSGSAEFDPHTRQAMATAMELALARRSTATAEDLLLVLIEQDTAEVARVFEMSGLSRSDVRLSLLAHRGLPSDATASLAPLDLPGTGDVPPLPPDALPRGAVAALRERQHALGGRAARGPAGRRVLWQREDAWLRTVAARYALTDAERSSLRALHFSYLTQEVAGAADGGRSSLHGGVRSRAIGGARPRSHGRAFAAARATANGWATWTSNRWLDVRALAYRVTHPARH